MQPDNLQEYAVHRQLQSQRHPQAQECPSRTAIVHLNGSSLQEPANHHISHLLKHIHLTQLLHQPLLLHTTFLAHTTQYNRIHRIQTHSISIHLSCIYIHAFSIPLHRLQSAVISVDHSDRLVVEELLLPTPLSARCRRSRPHLRLRQLKQKFCATGHCTPTNYHPYLYCNLYVLLLLNVLFSLYVLLNTN